MYETIIIFHPDLTDDEVSKEFNKIKDIINKNGAVKNEEIWGKRKLAYPIQKQNWGYYMSLKFQINDPSFIDELNRIYNTTDSIMKHIIVKMD